LLALRLAADFAAAHGRDEDVAGDPEIGGRQGRDAVTDLHQDRLYRALGGTADGLHRPTTRPLVSRTMVPASTEAPVPALSATALLRVDPAATAIDAKAGAERAARRRY
jgi:hypothetical protein